MARTTASILLALSMIAVLPRDGRGQSDNDDLATVQAATALASAGRPLAAIHALETAALDGDLASQMLATLYSFAEDWEKVQKLTDLRRRRNTVAVPPKAVFQPAKEAIIAQARDRQIVIVNEAHDLPEHRLFILELARELRKAGFNDYAMETLQEPPATLQSRGYPVSFTGFYADSHPF